MNLKIKSPSIDNHQGQALPFALILIPLFLILIQQTLYFSRLIERKIALQNGVDAALISGIKILSEGLNRISTLNQNLVRCHKLLILAQAGTVVTGNGGLLLTVEALKKMIRAIALKQEMIKQSVPLIAAQKTLSMARKNNTPHSVLSPPLFRYSIERLPPTQGLPSPYVLNPDFDTHRTWSISGFKYKHAYRAHAKAALFGDSLMLSNWKGYISE